MFSKSRICKKNHGLTNIPREQLQNARENPLAAAAAAAAVSGAPPTSQANNENLLDFDFDGTAPASAQKSQLSGISGLDGLAGTPQRLSSPTSNDGPAFGSNNLEDLMGLSNGSADVGQMNGHPDMLSGFASLDLGAATQPPPARQQLTAGHGGKKTNEDLLGLF